VNQEILPKGTTTVVVEEKRRRKGAFLWIAAATAALLVGGSSYALWQDNATFQGGTIQAGNLDLVTNSSTQWYDISRIDGADNIVSPAGLSNTAADLRADETTAIKDAGGKTLGLGHTVDPTTWRIVPGDTVAAVYSATVLLKGDNLVADLNLSSVAASAVASDGSANADSTSDTNGVSNGDEATSADNTADDTDSEVSGGALTGSKGFTDSGNQDLTYQYALYRDGVLAASGAVPANGTIVTLASSEETPGADATTGATPVVAITGGKADITVVLTAHFSASVQHRQDVTAAQTMGDVTLTLAQSRSKGAQFAPAAPVAP